MDGARPKTILLVFIHGFKGDDRTFAAFPARLSALLSTELAPPASSASPPPTITPLLYPAFETRGSLSDTVSRFRAWLLEKVIDAEVALGTPSPTVHPAVGVVVVGHSMGGIVAAESILGIWDEYEAEGGMGAQPADASDTRPSVFPKVLGVLAFDTPYLGIAPGVVKYGAEEQWREGKAWYDGAVGMFGAAGLGGVAAGAKADRDVGADKGKINAAPDPATSVPGPQSPKSPTSWASGWGKTALLATAGAATLAATSAAAYAGRQHITSGVNWVSSHLEFVGCLARPAELQARLGRLTALADRGELGFANVYTILGSKGDGIDRTFCRLPKAESEVVHWERARNPKAKNEVDAHMWMFAPVENPEYEEMGRMAVGLVKAWVPGEWRDGAIE